MEKALDPGVITNLLNAYTLVLTDGGFTRLLPDAMWLLRRLALIELVMVALWWGFSSEEALAAALAKMIWISVFVGIVLNWPYLTHLAMRSFVAVGLKAAGGVLSVQDFSNPARIARFGFEVTAVLSKKIEGYSGLWSIMNLPLMFIEGLVFVG